MDTDASLDRIFMALADRTRRRMLEQLRQGPLSAGELAEGSPLSQPAVSKHLKVLEAAGLVQRERAGNRIYSALDLAPLVRAAIFVSQFEKVVDARLDRFADVVEHRHDHEREDR